MTLPHCKDYPSHTHPVVAPAQPTQHVVATYLSVMECENSVQTWGVLLNKNPKVPLSGMHLLPGSILAFADAIEATGNQCVGGEVCVIVHTFDKQWRQFAAVAAADCPRLADDIRTEYAKRL